MKFCRICVLSAALVFLFGDMANAMTSEEFFARKSENLKLATHVIGQSEAGGVQGQLERAKGAIALAGKETDPSKKEVAAKLAWFYAVHSAFLADTAIPQAEAGPYQKAAVQALIEASQALGVPQPGLEKLMAGTVQLLGEAEKQMSEGAVEDRSSETASRPTSNTESPKLPREEFSKQYLYSQDGCTGNIRFLENGGLGRVEIQTFCGSSTCDAEYNIINILYNGPSRIIELADTSGRTNRLVSKHGYILENNDIFYCGNGGMMKGEYLDQSIYGSKTTQNKDIPSSEEQKIANLLQLAKTAHAQSEKAGGRSFPALTANAQTYKRLDSELTNAMIKYRDSIMSKDFLIKQEYVAKAWEDIGYSLDSTFRDTFSSITLDQYFRCQRDGIFNLFLITLQLFQDESTLKTALEKGLVSRDSAVAFLSATQRVSDAMKQVQQ